MPRHTDEEKFGTDYREKSHLQRGFNPHLIDDLVDYILRAQPSATEKPIRMIDLCCGDGGATYLLLKKLDEKGIRVHSLCGLDISPEQIARANEYAANDSRLSFAVQDVNTFETEERVDVVLSLFGLHWVEDVSTVFARVEQCLKPDGLLMFFVPLEKSDLFLLRRQLVQSPKWHDEFVGFSLEPFIAEPENYFCAMPNTFVCENGGGDLWRRKPYF